MFCWRVVFVLVLMVVLALTLVMGEVVVAMALLRGSYCCGSHVFTVGRIEPDDISFSVSFWCTGAMV